MKISTRGLIGLGAVMLLAVGGVSALLYSPVSEANPTVSWTGAETSSTVAAHAVDMARPGHRGWHAAEGSGCLVWRWSSDNPKAGEAVTWTGACEDKKASGEGTLLWYENGEPGLQYVGEMRDGKRNGRGKTTWPTGGSYEGGYKNGEQHGRGINIWAKGDRYEGQYVDGQRTGRGTYVWPNPTPESLQSYEGDWLEGKKNGHGVAVYGSGDRYEGDWVNDEYNGHGTAVWADPARFGHRNGVKRYEGKFQHNSFVGPGKVTWANGDHYEGEIRGGPSWGNFIGWLQPTGRGKKTMANGDWYEGKWYGGRPHGAGTAKIGRKKYSGVWDFGCLRSMEQSVAWGKPLYECP